MPNPATHHTMDDTPPISPLSFLATTVRSTAECPTEVHLVSPFAPEDLASRVFCVKVVEYPGARWSHVECLQYSVVRRGSVAVALLLEMDSCTQCRCRSTPEK